MKVLISWSSGKDSAWTLHVMQREQPGACAALLTTITDISGFFSFLGIATLLSRLL